VITAAFCGYKIATSTVHLQEWRLVVATVDDSKVRIGRRRQNPSIAEVTARYVWRGQDRDITRTVRIDPDLGARLYQPGNEVPVYVRIYDGAHMAEFERPKDPRNLWLLGAVCGVLWTGVAFVMRRR
jgi:Protein of unknown function (DUF3592)